MKPKVTCILTSFNRPNLVQQALRSVAQQTYRSYELLVIDDSTLMDVTRLVERHSFPAVKVWHFDINSDERASRNRLGVNINHGLKHAQGDLICFLADDDYLWPEWFEKGAEFFEKYPGIQAGFGTLFYSTSSSMDFSITGTPRWFDHPVSNPTGKLDHNQVMHRRLDPPILWPETKDSVMMSDAIYFEKLALHGPLHPIHCSAAVKRLHSKNLQNHIPELEQGKLENLRD